MYIDRNMVDTPFFRLANEGNRGVYVPAESIDAAGNTDWMQGRKHKELGRVLELVSEGKVNTYTFVVDGSWRYYKDGQVTFSYSWNDSRDNTSYNGNVANSATLYQMVVDDPRDLSKMSYSDNQWRHKVVFYGTTPSFWGMNIGVRFSGLGGTRFSAITGNIFQIISNRQIDLLILYLIFDKQCFIDCFLYADGLREKIYADRQIGRLSFGIKLFKIPVYINTAGLIAAIADPKIDKINSLFFDRFKINFALVFRKIDTV